MSGKVILVGAGPGSPDLLTLRGAEALRDADVVVYDALASSRLLDLAPERARRINVGKRGHDAPTRTQEETTALLVSLAREGKTVVRLKGGDPYVFGRGGEEAGACAEAGVPFEVVPGVSSLFGALAYAGIPITDRRHSASFAVVTGHKDPTKVTRETRWDLLAQAADTLVIMMGMRNLEQIVQRLLEAGRSPSTPAAVVMQGTLPEQQVVEAPLGEIAARADEAELGAPALVIVGEVVKLRGGLAWYESQPLFGRRVLVTRSPDQAGELLDALAAAGAAGVSVPMIRLAPAEASKQLDTALADLAAYHAVVFTSANAVRFTEARAASLGIGLDSLRAEVVCVGPHSAERARAAGLAVSGLPARFDAEGILELLRARGGVEGRRILLPQSDLARPTLAEGLRAAGARVDAVVAYQNLPAAVDADALRADLCAGRFDALTFTSPSTARRFAELLDPPAREAATRCTVAAIGPITAKALERVGLPPDVTAPRASAAELVAALANRMEAKGDSR